MAQAQVTAIRTWLTDPLDPGGGRIVCGSRRPTGQSLVDDGEVRKFAGGRTQLVHYDSSSGEFPITLVNLGPVDVAQLRTWRGRTLLLRTIDGTRLYGGFLTMTLAAYPRLATWDVDIVVQSVSYTDVLAS